MHVFKTASLAAVIAAGMLLSGCATRESVEHAQATADEARGDATAAHSAADRAQSSADAAGKTANDAMSLAQNANDKVDKLMADMERRRHVSAYHRHHHRRHVATAENSPPNCPVPQQKSELKTHQKKTASLLPKQLKLKHDKTAQN
jgi:hypothetical protein